MSANPEPSDSWYFEMQEYQEDRENAIRNAAEALADQWAREYRRTGKIRDFSAGWEHESNGETFGATLDRLALDAVNSKPEFYLDRY